MPKKTQSPHINSSSKNSQNPPKSLLTPVEELWGGMLGKIFLINSAWNKDRYLEIVDHELKKEDTTLREQMESLGIDKEKTLEVINILFDNVQYKNFIVSGDFYATNCINLILNWIYPPENIIIKSNITLKINEDNIYKEEYFNAIIKENLILISGPAGNPIAKLILDKAGLSWLFCKQPGRDFGLSINPDSQEYLTPFGKLPDTLEVDYGVFLRLKNPFNPEKRVYATMGIHSYGTQGAAAVACSEDSAKEIINMEIDPKLRENGVEYIALIKVWNKCIKSKKNKKLAEFIDPGILYKIEFPKPSSNLTKYKTHQNPFSTNKSINNLKDKFKEETLFLGSKPSSTFLYSFWFFCVIFFGVMLIIDSTRMIYIIPLLILSLFEMLRNLFKLLTMSN